MKRSFRKVSLILFCAVFFNSIALSQGDPNPNSPVPILHASVDNTRVLAFETRRAKSGPVQKSRSFYMPGRNSLVTMLVSNVDLMPGEGASAFRVYLEQKSGKTFELDVRDLSKGSNGTYALTVRLYDRDGYRGQPVADGDSLIYLTWRGLKSNVLKLGLGRTGGAMKVPDTTLSAPTKFSEPPSSDYVGYRFAGDRIRFLEQAGFGPSTELDNRIRRIGVRTWLAEQFEEPYPTIPMPDPPQMPLTPPADCSLTTNHVCYRERYTMTPLQQWFFKEAMYGRAQVRHRVAWALSQIFVTSGVAVQQSSHQIAYNKILSQHAFGNYRDLLYDVTLSPTMGFYLDMVRSTRTNPNENYPREILQLFSVGLYMLNQDGTLKLDDQGQPIPTYSQESINNFSKVFTGWTYCNITCPNSAPGILNYKDPMILVPGNHDTTGKTLLNYPNPVNLSIPACDDCTTPEATTAYANDSLNGALDNIFHHPNVAPFIGKLLIQHLVTSDPSPAYVGRVSVVFNNNGSGVRGDLKAVIRAILLDPEARGDLKTAPRYVKLREPVQLITSLARIFPAQDWYGVSTSDGGLSSYAQKLGQNPFYSPTVFNYFSPDYVVPGTTVLAPEFEILNTGTAVSRTNLLYILTFEGLTPNGTDATRGTALTYAEFLPYAEADPTGNQLLDILNYRMMHGSLLPAHRDAILTAVQVVPVTDPLARVKTAVYLIAVSSQYQIQR
jgi:uncharacterized protein (DUF1800 family)